MNIEAEWLLALIAFPVIGYFFKSFISSLEKHERRRCVAEDTRTYADFRSASYPLIGRSSC